ncbi:ferrous iron transport protein A [Sphingomonas histidinilytica]|jgi:ferrous iron transport protein A|uniref:Ferrous iron transport protein A n=1 Tax=Rhizorhabdus histidinilytica TaxID=439228 RepID=A0A1T5FG07_9SPHN|nr:FeoA family protein [Rhizorhabdus histidinilytica]MBO9375669.1 ferrous iron transport protein A [Rhizorhabdus histidinilytica]QEH81111.1 ferrous iron transport protein A [Sphingomonas sp. C8-2]SKB95093.1 ferrous iron transport protein A [Rhizorhabdus histidinilytica]
MTDDAAPTTLDKLPLRSGGAIVGIDWDRLSERDARRLRELGVDEGVPVEKLHKGPFGVDPIACRIGRMTVALRSAQAAAIAVGPLKSK